MKFSHIEIVDAHRICFCGVLPKGKNRVEWNVDDQIVAGIYLVRLRTGGQTGAGMTAPVRVGL